MQIYDEKSRYQKRKKKNINTFGILLTNPYFCDVLSRTLSQIIHKKGGTAMKPVWYNYEAEEYDLDNACNEDDDRRTDTRGTSVYTTYGQWSAEVPDTSVWYD